MLIKTDYCWYKTWIVWLLLTRRDINKWMLTFKLWWPEQCRGTVRFVIMSLWVSWHIVFAIYGKIVCDLSFRPAAFERGERGGTYFGAGAAADGSKFPLSRWSQGRIKPPNNKGEAGFAFLHSRQKFRRHPATIHYLVVPSSSWFEKLRCSSHISSIL